ncbi:MAG: hypothetical protein F6K36_18410 [Symploca sp. SIO3C6]|nr:hypothetical protein [Symploca sp. SIO3C6]
MKEIPLCRIVISSPLPSSDLELLEISLGMSSIAVQKSPSRFMGVDDLVVVATLLGGAAATANLIECGIKVAKVINNWRRQLREKGIELEGSLENPKYLPLDLSKATDEEIEAWLSQK